MERDDATVETIRHLQGLRHRAMLDADPSALDLLLDESLSYTHSDASRDDKASYLAKVRNGDMRYTGLTTSEDEVRVLAPDCVCVLGRMKLSGDLFGVAKQVDNRFAAVWIRRGGKWRLAVFQPTPVPPSFRASDAGQGDL